MAADFVALVDLLRAPAPNAAAVEAVPAPVAACDGHPGVDGDDAAAVLRDVRLFRARLADAFDDAAARLLRELASDVLARELRLAPCELAAIVRRVAGTAPVVRVRVAACELVRDTPLARGYGVALVEDASLARGDAVVELAGGALDARLGVRLATVLEAFA